MKARTARREVRKPYDWTIAMITKIDPKARLNGFAKAYEFACRHSERRGDTMTIIRTGRPEQPFRVTAEPEDDAEIAAEILP